MAIPKDVIQQGTIPRVLLFVIVSLLAPVLFACKEMEILCCTTPTEQQPEPARM